MNILVSFISEMLLQLYVVVGDLGLAIIVFTVLIRSLLIPLTLPSHKAQQKLREIQPELAKLKKKHGNDKKALQAAQVELYAKYNVNPLSGCIPQLVQLGVLIVLYQSLVSFLHRTEVNGAPIDFSFLIFDLSKPDRFILPILAGVTQFILSLMIFPGASVRDVVPNTSKKKAVQEANKKEEDLAEMGAMMQQQMLYMMPIMTGFFASRFPAGLALYWVATTIFSIIQQYFVSGWGGLLEPYQKLKARFSERTI